MDSIFYGRQEIGRSGEGEDLAGVDEVGIGDVVEADQLGHGDAMAAGNGPEGVPGPDGVFFDLGGMAGDAEGLAHIDEIGIGDVIVLRQPGDGGAEPPGEGPEGVSPPDGVEEGGGFLLEKDLFCEAVPVHMAGNAGDQTHIGILPACPLAPGGAAQVGGVHLPLAKPQGVLGQGGAKLGGGGGMVGVDHGADPGEFLQPGEKSQGGGGGLGGGEAPVALKIQGGAAGVAGGSDETGKVFRFQPGPLRGLGLQVVIEAEGEAGGLGGGMVLGEAGVHPGLAVAGADIDHLDAAGLGGGEVHIPLESADVHPLHGQGGAGEKEKGEKEGEEPFAHGAYHLIVGFPILCGGGDGGNGRRGRNGGPFIDFHCFSW